MQMHDNQTLTSLDMVSINALVESLALQNRLQRENIYYLLEAEFKVRSVMQIKRSDLGRAVSFLVDLQNVTVH